MGLLLLVAAALALLALIPGLALAKQANQTAWTVIMAWRPWAMVLCMHVLPFALNAGGRLGQFEPFLRQLQMAICISAGAGIGCAIKQLRMAPNGRRLLGSAFIAAALTPAASIFTTRALAALFRVELYF